MKKPRYRIIKDLEDHMYYAQVRGWLYGWNYIRSTISSYSSIYVKARDENLCEDFLNAQIILKEKGKIEVIKYIS